MDYLSPELDVAKTPILGHPFTHADYFIWHIQRYLAPSFIFETQIPTLFLSKEQSENNKGFTVLARFLHVTNEK